MVVVIPYLNNPLDLAVLLTQLQSQTVAPTAIYIADNSVDGSGFEIAKRYHFSVPIAVQKKVGSIHESWNAGIKFAQEDDVAILNDDVMIPNNFIEIYNIYLSTKDAMMFCPANDGFPPTEAIRKGYQWNNKGSLTNYETLEAQEYVLPPSLRGWCMVIPHSTIKTVGLFDEKFNLYFGDKDYEARIFEAKGKIGFISGCFVNHFGSSSTKRMESKDVNDHYNHDETYYMQKHNIPLSKK